MEDDLRDRAPHGDSAAFPRNDAPNRLSPDLSAELSPNPSPGTFSAGIRTPGAGLNNFLPAVRAVVSAFNKQAPLLSSAELVSIAADTEELSRLVDHLQIMAAAALERARISTETTDSWADSSGELQQEYKSTAEYLRHRLRISRREAWRRIRLGSSLTSSTGIAGQRIDPEFSVLAEAATSGRLSGEAAQLVSLAMKRVQGCGTVEDRTAMETGLTDVAASQDLDALNVVANAWVNHLDPDGTQPTEQQKAELQGLFIRRNCRGLRRLDIYATEDQFETLMTALSPGTNPRAGTPEPAGGTCVDLEGKERAVPPDTRSYPQKCLDGLVASCAMALSMGQLPDNGGSKPQVMAVIPYDLLRESVNVPGTGGPDDGRRTAPQKTPEGGMLTFAGPVPVGQIRRIACDADIIPVVLSGESRILDVGTASRYFPPYLRRALVARDRGCAFPGCTAPAPWCEAHHISYHSHGGSTGTDNGVMLCGFHHHLIHRGKWRISVLRGAPWFIPPTYVDPFQAPLRNTYFHPLRPHRVPPA